MNREDLQLSIIIPVYNEELTIGNIIDRTEKVIERTGLTFEIIVVDDCSNDKSLEAVKRRNTKNFTFKRHLGKGYALRAGFTHAKGNIIVTIDSDGSHKPEELPRLLAPVLENKADLVIGSRYMNHKKVTAKKLNAFGVKFFNHIIELLVGVTITDSQSGFRAMKTDVLKSQKLKSGEYEIESEMLIKTIKQNFRVTEVPISFEQRTYGTSGINPIFDGVKILISIVLSSMKA
jgi:glycosyltransferase involved in cell wall biosynthesis